MKFTIEGIDYTKTLGPWMGKTSKMMEDEVIYQLKKANVDLSKRQWIVLNLIQCKNGISQKCLAEFVNRDKTSVARFLSNLEKKGFLERKVSSADKRIIELYITAKGIEEVNKATPVMSNFANQIQEDLTEKEIQDTIKVLKKIQDKLIQIKKNKLNQ